MPKRSFKKPAYADVIDTSNNVDEICKRQTISTQETEESKQHQQQVIARNQVLYSSRTTLPGVPPPINSTYRAPEAEMAEKDAALSDLKAQAVLRPPRSGYKMNKASQPPSIEDMNGSEDEDEKATSKLESKPKSKSKPKSNRKQRSATLPPDEEQQMRDLLKVEDGLTKEDWETVANFYQHTNKTRTIAMQAGLRQKQTRHLIEHGIIRLKLPPIKDACIDRGELNVKAEVLARQHQRNLFSDDVAKAIQSRATKEAASARAMLQQSIQAGNIVAGYIKALFESLQSGQSQLHIPEIVTTDTLDTMTKVVDAHTRAMERAIKMVRLTQGEPTELIEHQIGAMLAVCTTRELEEAAATGSLPRRLTSRILGSDPIEAQAQTVITGPATATPTIQKQQQEQEPKQKQEQAQSEQPAQSAQSVQPEQPEWLQSIISAEGASKTAVED